MDKLAAFETVISAFGLVLLLIGLIGDIKTRWGQINVDHIFIRMVASILGVLLLSSGVWTGFLTKNTENKMVMSKTDIELKKQIDNLNDKLINISKKIDQINIPNIVPLANNSSKILDSLDQYNKMKESALYAKYEIDTMKQLTAHTSALLEHLFNNVMGSDLPGFPKLELPKPFADQQSEEKVK